jgi:NADPH-dependent glutamate synthase beta subunit-like oxidoreductase
MANTTQKMPTTWTTLWTDSLNTGTWRSALPVYQDRPSPCHVACPLGGAIPRWVEKLNKEEYAAAWRELAQNNPFPSVTGRVCHHPCESSCNRGEYDEKLSVKLLERYLGDMALRQGWLLPAGQAAAPAQAPQNKRVAIVGAGPAGLSAACHLRRRGYSVEIFEASLKPGGLLRYGIPEYRLPKAILDGELQRLLQLGITIHCGSPLNTADAYSRLRRDYGAVFLAMGAQRPQSLPQLAGEPGLLYDGLAFLRQVNEGRPPAPGKHLAVIGGGNTAIDAARVAKRLGAAEVTLIYRRTREQMPCQPEEIIEAAEEGVHLLFLAAPLKIERQNGMGMAKLICQQMRLGENDASGRPRPEAIADAFISLEVDQIITATGATPDLSGVDEGLGLTAESIAADASGQTEVKGIFAGGDLTGGERFVSAAIADGIKAAQSIDCYLQGLAPELKTDGAAVTYAEVNTFYFAKNPAVRNHTLPAAQRLHNFNEVQQGIAPEEAAAEAARCFICGRCVLCDNCFYYCPDMAIKRKTRDPEDPKGPANLADPDLDGYLVLEQYCKGCGLCVKECPRGALLLKEETL